MKSSFALLVLVLVSVCYLGPRLVHGEPIHPLMVGNNLWFATSANASSSPSAEIMGVAQEAGIRVIRIGGAEFNRNMPSNAALRTWVLRIRAIGAEPLVQVANDQTAAQAAAIVRALNDDPTTYVTYWSIGNEPLLEARRQNPGATEAEIAPTVEEYFKRIAAAMKGEDSAIKIFGIDSEDLQSTLHARLFGGANNIAGKVPGQDYYYCDGLAWHRYPQQPGVDPAREGLNDIRTRIINARALVDSVNQSEGRTGPDALAWAVTEFNSRNGEAVHTFGNGQMFAGVFGLAMKYGATFVTPWSLQESSQNPRGPTDFGLVEAPSMTRRPSFWHTQFVADYFRGNYLEGTPSIADATSDILVYGADDVGLDRVAVMILNRGTTPRAYTLHLNANASFGSGDILNVDANHPDFYHDQLSARSTHVLVFHPDSITRISYSSADFDSLSPPQTTVLPRPNSRLLDGFDYPSLADQVYWSPLFVGDSQVSVSDGQLTLRAANSAYASAAIASPVLDSFNFFDRPFTVSLTGFEQFTGKVSAEETHFRLSFNSSPDRSFRADDSLALRITPENVRFGYKINQLNVQGEHRGGASTATDSLEDFPYEGSLHTIRVSLAPEAVEPADGVFTIHYILQLEGDCGYVVRRGSFEANATEWGAGGDSSLVLESRRESGFIGGSDSFVETRLDKVFLHPGLIDDFDGYTDFSEQRYWEPIFVGGASTAEVAASSAVLTARADAFASAALAGPVTADLNFLDQAFSLQISNLAVTSANLSLDQTIFRLSLNSSSERSFRAPDSLTLRVRPDRVRLGYKLAQPNVDAENRAGAENVDGFLLDFDPEGVVEEIQLTLAPVGRENPRGLIFYAICLGGSFGMHHRSGTFTTEGLWGTSENLQGDSALVLEARRSTTASGDESSFAGARFDSVAYVPIPEDFFDHAPHFAAWRLRHFGTEDLDDISRSGATAIPNGDTIPNLLKYAFGLTPRIPANRDLLPFGQFDGAERLVLIHEERVGASDIFYEVEASADLETWSLPVIEIGRTDPEGGWRRVTSRADLDDPFDQTFFRVRVSAPEEE